MASVLITRECPKCHRAYQNSFPAEGIRNWQKGMLIQNALPKCTADEREFLITGICPECWDKMAAAAEAFEERYYQSEEEEEESDDDCT